MLGALVGGLLLAGCGNDPVQPPTSPGPETFRVQSDDNTISYTNSEGADRQVTYRLWYPLESVGPSAVIVISHGGSGAFFGHTLFAHLAEEYARHGYVVGVLNHRRSTTTVQHRTDRPNDVGAFLDFLLSSEAELPDDFDGSLDGAHVGHVGHSWGAYTSHAVAGASFDQGSFRDPRIDAVVPLSPQGWGQFGTFDTQEDITLPSSSNSWAAVTIPAYNLLGELEKDGSVIQNFITTDWRLFPFIRYPAVGDKFLSVLPGQGHSDLGGNASASINQFVARNTRIFFDVYLRGETVDVCAIGFDDPPQGIDTRRRPDPTSSLASRCE